MSLAEAKEHPDLESPTLEVVLDWTMVRLWTKRLDRHRARWLLGVSREHEDVRARAATINAMGTAIVGARDGFLFTRPPSSRIQKALTKRMLEGLRDSHADIRLASLAGLIETGVASRRGVFRSIQQMRRDDNALVRDRAASYLAECRAGGEVLTADEGRFRTQRALRGGLCAVLGIGLSALVAWVYHAWEPAGLVVNSLVCMVAIVAVLRAVWHWNDAIQSCPNCGGARRACR